jgi:hypothetical protein
MNQYKSMLKSGLAAAVAAATLTLTGCYVVPINGHYSGTYSSTYPQATAVVPAPGPIQIQARLYPANEAAAQYGVVSGNIVNHLNGHGTFNLVLGGEALNGEATRLGNSRSGSASAASPRGLFMRCSYTMNNPTQGTGSCTLSNGAAFNMHIAG